MVAWNKLLYYLNGYWIALPVASVGEIHRYALANQVDLLVLEAGNPNVADAKLVEAVPGFDLDAIFYAESSLYRVAFYRPRR